MRHDGDTKRWLYFFWFHPFSFFGPKRTPQGMKTVFAKIITILVSNDDNTYYIPNLNNETDIIALFNRIIDF